MSKYQIVGALALVTLGLGLGLWLRSSPAPLPASSVPVQDAGSSPASPLASVPVSSPVPSSPLGAPSGPRDGELSFVIKGAYVGKDGVLRLNSKPLYQHPENKSVVLDTAECPSYRGQTAFHLVGRTVRAKGISIRGGVLVTKEQDISIE